MFPPRFVMIVANIIWTRKQPKMFVNAQTNVFLRARKRSPIRAFDEVANGGLKAGELGLVTSKKGLGKTSVLVQFGMDTLLNGKQLVHVSFDQHSSNVISWYDSIFSEISKKKAISSDVKDQLIRNRTILNFNQDNFSLEKVVNTLNAHVLFDPYIGVNFFFTDFFGLNVETGYENWLRAGLSFKF